MDWLRHLLLRDLPLSARGEQAATRFLHRKGYRIKARNVHVGKDEADVVALTSDGRTLVIVEVKTRSAGEILPEEQVGSFKQHRVNRLAAKLLQRREFEGCAVRFDVIAVVWPDGARQPTIRHHEGAFLSKL